MDSLIKKIKEKLSIYNPPILLNEFIEGREFTVGVIGNDNPTVLPIVEIDLSNLPDNLNKLYSFEVKIHQKGKTVYHIPAPLSDDERKLIESTAIKAFKALKLRDYARVDIKYKDGIPYVLEINSLPGLMKGFSFLYRMAEKTELGYDGIILKIVDTAIERYGLSNAPVENAI